MGIEIIALLGLLVIAVAGLGGILFFYMIRRRQEGRATQAEYASLRSELQNSLSSNLKLVTAQLANVTSQVNGQLSTVTLQLQNSTGQINSRMDNATRAVGEVRQGLGELSKATERLFEIGKDISSLQEILRAPKLRGGLGEFFLGDLLAQCLPSAHYSLQHAFRNGKIVDAVIRLNDGLVPIDSKFPLENFRRMLEGPTEEAKKAAKRKFAGDCKKHIDAIASSYILPGEGTFNFALMYIPAENVYYETIIKDDEGDEKLILGYAFSKRVIPVSPNSFYAYLQTILLGLRGMEISEKALAMHSHIEGLKNDFVKFSDDFETLGRHINNSKGKYDEAARKADKLGDKLKGLGGGGEKTPDEDVIEKEKL
ncbi:MAG: DNA recombination protein RmuC [Deltaproteobacteria bacterium]|nr:DNA recombination protein RmuC [Deltaproteobacteria bacterium]